MSFLRVLSLCFDESKNCITKSFYELQWRPVQNWQIKKKKKTES